jgi:hypothetical protein
MEQEILPNEENGNTGIILSAMKIQVFVEPIQFSVDHGVSVEEIEEIHEP